MRKTKTFVTILTGLSVAVLVVAASARAEDQPIKLGVSIATTGPASALGIPERNTLSLFPETIGGAKIEIIQLDDAGDPTAATTNARRLATDDKVDVLIGSSTVPPSIAMGNVAAEVSVPHFALAPMPITPTTAKWSVVMPQPVSLMAKAIYEHMKKNGVKTVGLIGFSDSWGDLWVKDFKKNAEPLGLKMVVDERFGRADTSVTGQALKLVAAKPDAVLVAGSGTAAALPVIALRERGYKGPIYQTHGAVTKDFIRIGGKAAEGTIFTSGPMMVAEQQSDSALTKKPGMAFVQAYEPKYGKDTRNGFGAYMWDVLMALERVIPPALKKAKPGTQEFREAIREALIAEKEIATSQAVFNWTEKDRYGVDDRAVVLLTIKGGNWELIK